MASIIRSAARVHRARGIARKTGLLAGLVLLSGCAAVDHFGPRSARFNATAVDGRSQAILANILRAAYGKPLQFSDLTTVTGQSTLNGEVGTSIPFAVDPVTTARTYSAAPKISASGTSTFNMAYLDSREFYNGLQTPISVENIANFIASGYDKQLLLFLAISDIEVRDPTRRLAFHSDAADPNNYRLFYQAIAYLREAGISTRKGQATPVGPALSAPALRDPKVVATMLSSAAGDLSLKEDPPKSGQYRFFRKAGLEFCFDSILIDKTLIQQQRATVLFNTPGLREISRAPATPIPGALVLSGQQPVAATTFQIDPAYFCDPPPGAERDKKSEIVLTPRSVEGVFQFLGQIARAQLGLAKGGATDGLAIQKSDSSGPLLPFRVIEGAPADAAVTIHAEGKSYSIVADPSGSHDESTRVFQLLTDLLAIQSSAKDLPTPNVISILTP